jgi:hypothetical protein
MNVLLLLLLHDLRLIVSRLLKVMLRMHIKLFFVHLLGMLLQLSAALNHHKSMIFQSLFLTLKLTLASWQIACFYLVMTILLFHLWSAYYLMIPCFFIPSSPRCT